jgi:hypothetical protein
MRCMWWLALVAGVLIFANMRVASVASGKPRRLKTPVAAAPAAGPRAPERGEDVDGYGKTAEKARERALARAVDRVEELLLERYGRSGWRPSPEQLEPDYLARFGVVAPRGEPEPAPVKGEQMLVARYRVALTPEYIGEVARQARQARVQERHLLLARVLAGLLALALVTAGYLRLEESTRGYATQLLRAAALVVLALVGAGLFLTM